jgi:hypothetical protein
MPTDLGLIITNLTSFYDFTHKLVVHVGAGGGQLLGYAPVCRRILAVDNDAEAMRRLEERIAADALENRVSPVSGDFNDLDLHGDVVLFEFCLHEMPEPRAAIDRARATAADVLVIDHLPDSQWAWYANEAPAMARAWEAVAAMGAKRQQSYQARQRFDDYRALQAKFSTLGDESHRRIGAFDGQTAIVIPMPYGIALL